MAKLICILALATVALAVDREPLFNWFKGLDTNKVLYAVSAGGPEDFTDAAGIQFRADTGFIGGNPSSDGYQHRWQLPNSEVYQTERWGEFSYELPLDKNTDGKHTLIFKFSEIYFKKPNEKVFDVSIGSTTIIKHLDIFSNVGTLMPFDVFVEFELKRGKLFIEGSEVTGAFNGSKLKVDFNMGYADNPKVNAIVLMRGGVESTHKKNHDKYIQTINDIMEERRQEKAKQEAFF